MGRDCCWGTGMGTGMIVMFGGGPCGGGGNIPMRSAGGGCGKGAGQEGHDGQEGQMTCCWGGYCSGGKLARSWSAPFPRNGQMFASSSWTNASLDSHIDDPEKKRIARVARFILLIAGLLVLGLGLLVCLICFRVC